MPLLTMRWLPIVLIAAMLAVGSASEPGSSAMSIGQAMILGLVEGLTEYLPVSSTGHLILAQRAMGIGGDDNDAVAADAYAICIQSGAILAALGLYVGTIRRVVNGGLGRDPEGFRLGLNLLIGFLPAAVIGLIFVDLIKKNLFGLWPVVIAWFLGGIAILTIDRFRANHPSREGRDLFSLSWRGALVIGFIQCLAMWPGTSRSLVTIVGGILVGLNLQSALVFSFLLGAVTLGASTAYDTVQHGSLMLATYGWPSLITGFLVSLLSAVVAVRWMVNYLKQHGLAVFGWYRIGLSILVGFLLLTDIISTG